MRSLVDECTGPAVTAWLRAENHHVFSLFDQIRRMDDDDIIQKALDEQWIPITNDKDFGDKVYRDGGLHKGVILLRLEDERPAAKIQVPHVFLKHIPPGVPNSFLVVTDTQVRFAGK